MPHVNSFEYWPYFFGLPIEMFLLVYEPDGEDQF